MTKIKTNPFLIIYAIIVMAVFAAADDETADPFFERLKNGFDKYNQDFNIEKAFLFTDRFVYRPGDDLWFKGFAVSPGKNFSLSFSDDMFVRLVNSKGEEVVFRRYPLTGNETAGRLMIPRSCIPGKYWLIAYTGWMKNRCPQEAYRKEILISKYFEKRINVEMTFEKLSYVAGDTMVANIRILDQLGKPVPETAFDYALETLRRTDSKGSGKTDIKGKSRIEDRISKTDEVLLLTIHMKTRKLSGSYSCIIPVNSDHIRIDIFPEGGKVVRGLENYIVLKATDKYGLPQIVSGKVVDANGQQYCNVQTGPSGSGMFSFIPATDSTFLLVDLPNGKQKKYALPYAEESGTLIHYPGDDLARINLTSTNPDVQKNYLIAVLNNKIVWTKTVDFARSTWIDIPVKELNKGIMQVSVFDEEQKLIAERLMQVNPQKKDISVKMTQQVYHTRQRVNMVVEYPSNLNKGDLAVSVALNNLSKRDKACDLYENIFSRNCEGSILQSTTGNNIDLEMIMSGFRYVDWPIILANSGGSSPYIRNDGLLGIVYDKKENVSQHAKVRVTHFPNLRFYETQTDENGRFHIGFGSDVVDYKYLNIDAYDALGKISLNTRIDDAYIRQAGKDFYNEANGENQKIADLQSYGEHDLIYVLRFGPGKFKSLKDSKKKYNPYKYANYTDILDIIQDIKPYRLIGNKILFFESEKNKTIETSRMDEAVIVINGKLRGTDVGLLKDILPSDITNINISESLLDVHKYTPLNFNGVIEITTIQGLFRYRQSHAQFGTGTFNNDREFDSPDYAVETSYSADSRKTLYWNPKITLQNNNSLILTFYTSDVKGLYTGRIIGIDPEGNPVEAEFSFRVE